MHLENTLPREISQAQMHRQKAEWWFPVACGAENGELLFNEHRVSVGGDERVLEMDGVMVVQQ